MQLFSRHAMCCVLGPIFLLFFACSVDTNQYQGDGKISRTGGVLISQGYEITFHSFVLGTLLDTVFYVKHLPRLKKGGVLLLRVDSICDTAIQVLGTRKAVLSVMKNHIVLTEATNTVLNAWDNGAYNSVIEYLPAGQSMLMFELLEMEDCGFRVRAHIDTRNLPSCAKGEVKVVLTAGGYL